MIKLCIVTATRAEYGIMKPLIQGLQQSPDFDTKLVVTGTHLSQEFGFTYKEIEEDGLTIDTQIAILSQDTSTIGVCTTMANALTKFAVYFESEKPDAVILLGDRYETLAIACAAYNTHIPIVHLYGGDTTEGALDEAYRHAITKMSYLHFVSNEDSRRRVIQLGENPARVFNVGSLGIENALHEQLLSMRELEDNLDFTLSGGYAVVTFHPVTLEKETAITQCMELVHALEERNDLNYIITKSNADAGGQFINEIWDSFANEHDNVYVTTSLGMKRYLSAVSHARMVLGNSSSGVYEVPAFHIPTVNIGDRQRGRLHGETVINCSPDKTAILQAMRQAEDPAFLSSIADAPCLYGNGDTSAQMLALLKEELGNKTICLKKVFYDLPL